MLRLLAATAAALSLGAVLAVAAPGLGTQPYLPEPVEFDLAAPAPPASVAASRGFVSPEVRVEKRFNLVGLSWRSAAEPGIALRARQEGGDWTRWTPAGADGRHGRGRSTSAPVWVGEADWVQYRMSRRVPGLRLHFVNTMGTATATDRAVTRLRALAREAVVRIGSPALAAVRRPKIRPRSEWGAEHCPTRGVAYGRVRAAVVHHTVTANEYSRAQTPAAILAVCRFHRNTNGWNDIGYNFVVDRFGQVWEGRAGGVDEAVYGSQAQGYNGQTTGIANLGTFTSEPQSDAAIGAMARLIAWKLPNHGVPTSGTTTLTSAGGPSARYSYGTTRRFNRVIGHRDTGRTACPGDQLYFQLGELRERVGERRPTGERVRLSAPFPEVVTYSPDGVSFGGQLLDRDDGLPVVGATVELQRLRRTGWRTVATSTTDPQGSFSATVEIARYTVLRWRFGGDERYRVYRGDGAGVQVAPLMTLASSAPAATTEEPVDLSGTIDPAKSAGVTLVFERADEFGAWRRVSRKAVRPRDGAFTLRRRFRTSGHYRLSARFAGDALNAPSTSPYVELTVEEPLFEF